jgi:hypothetical protein
MPGSSVLVEELPDGELRIVPTDKVRERIREIGQRVVAEHSEALQILADHDPDTPSPSRWRTVSEAGDLEWIYLTIEDVLGLYTAITGGATTQASDQLRNRPGLTRDWRAKRSSRC